MRFKDGFHSFAQILTNEVTSVVSDTVTTAIVNSASDDFITYANMCLSTSVSFSVCHWFAVYIYSHVLVRTFPITQYRVCSCNNGDIVTEINSTMKI